MQYANEPDLAQREYIDRNFHKLLQFYIGLKLAEHWWFYPAETLQIFSFPSQMPVILHAAWWHFKKWVYNHSWCPPSIVCFWSSILASFRSGSKFLLERLLDRKVHRVMFHDLYQTKYDKICGHFLMIWHVVKCHMESVSNTWWRQRLVNIE